MDSRLRIRMYRQGLGDCFLLTMPADGKEVHILIDCGVLKGTSNAQARMRKIAESIFDATGGRLDILIITHEHWDHVSGFVQAEEVFNRFTISEVWLAWTEKPDDELAIELRQRKARVLKAIVAAADQLSRVTGLGARRIARRLDGLLQFSGEKLSADSRHTTAKAMAWAKGRTQSKVRFLFPRDTFIVPGTQAVRAFVLGPPYDAARIRKSRPSKRVSEVYELAAEGSPDFGFLAAVEAGATGDPSERPFENWFRADDKSTSQEGFFTRNYWPEDGEWRRIEDDWLQAAGQLALQLDSHTNNTSLVLAFELPGTQRVLLFPGDAQVGNWLSWEDLSWDLKEEGAVRNVSAHSLLARTILYKVGHHGSHNATLREKGLELMASDDLVALLPVNRQTASSLEWNMPFPSLLRRLEQKTKGRILDCDKGIPAANPGLLSDGLWQQFVSQTDESEDWIDYRIAL